jgi:uncharacterized repeat protein (TIGR01451 family)
MKFSLQLRLVGFFLLCAQLLPAQWQSLKGPYGGLIFDIKTNSNQVMLSTSDGFFRSTNGGQWWEKTAEAFQENYSLFLLDANDTELLAISGKTVGFLPQKAVHVSTDGGDSWSVISTPDTFPSYFDGGAINGDHILLVGDQHIWESNDGGQNWFDSPLNASVTYPDCAASYNGRFYVTGYGKIAISDANGNNFVVHNIPSSAYILNIYVFDQTILMYDLAQERFYKSTNNGQTWIASTPDQMGNSRHQVAMLHDTLFTLMDGELAYSTNQGTYWTKIPGLPSDLLYMNYIAASQDHLIVGDDAAGLLRAPAATGPWTEATYGLHNSSVRDLDYDDTYLYATAPYRGLFRYDLAAEVWDTTNLLPVKYGAPDACVFNGKLFSAIANINNPFGQSVGRSTDHGNTWTNITPPGSGPFGGLSVFDRIIHNDNALFTWNSDQSNGLTTGILRSTDDGDNWTELSGYLLHGIGGSAIDLAVQGHTIWATTTTGIAKSTDNGVNWSLKNSNLPYSIAPNTPYMKGVFTVDNTVFVQLGTGLLFRSVDQGAHWEPAWSGLPVNNYPGSLMPIFDVFRFGGQLVCLSTNLYVSYDEGQHWTLYPGPLPARFSYSAKVRNNQLYLGTNERGVWEGTLDSFSLQPLSGRVFWDDNNNGVQDGTEKGVAGMVLSLNSYFQQIVTDSLGNYELYAYFDGSDAVLKPNTQPFPYTTISPASYTVQASGSGFNFAVYKTPGIQDLGVTCYMAGVPRPGFESNYYITASNLGTTEENGVVTFTLDPQLIYVSSNPPANTISGNTLTWNLDGLGYLDVRSLELRVKTPATTLIGAHVISTATISPTDPNPVNNTAVSDEEVKGSYDPNDKLEAHNGTISRDQVNAGEALVYTIRFQNTGNAAAEKVIVADQLPILLDPAGIQVLDASHAYTMDLRGNGYVEFTFDMINLPDSASNQAASQGYVRFAVQIRKEAPRAAEVRNTANIYFDFNTPIVTPPAITKIQEGVTGVSDLTDKAGDLRVMPNPSSGRFTVQMPEGVAMRGSLLVYNQNGGLVWQGRGNTVDLGNCPTGLYYAFLQGGDGKRYIGKIVVQH